MAVPRSVCVVGRGSAYHAAKSCHCEERSDEAISMRSGVIGGRCFASLAMTAKTGERLMDKRIVVVGAGAIGGHTAGKPAHNGFGVTLIAPRPEPVEAHPQDR